MVPIEQFQSFQSHRDQQQTARKIDLSGGVRFIIKLMKSSPRLEREAAHLDEQDFKKIFPDEYYQKYAPQQKIRQFQQQLLRQNKATPTPTLARRESTPQLARPTAPTKLSMFDTPSDVILKNKEETKRMEAFVKDVNKKLKNGPVGNAPKIRTPLTGFAALPVGVFDRLKLLQDAQYEAEMQYVREKKNKAKEYVSFVHRGNNSLSASKLDVKIERSIAGSSAQSKSIKDFNFSNTMLHSVQPIAHPKLFHSVSKKDQGNYEQRVRQIVDKARSQILSLNPQNKRSQVECIMTINKSIRKINNLNNQRATQRRISSLTKTVERIKTSSHSGSAPRKKKDLITMTQNVRAQVDSLELLSHFEAMVAQRSLRLRLEQIT